VTLQARSIRTPANKFVVEITCPSPKWTGTTPITFTATATDSINGDAYTDSEVVSSWTANQVACYLTLGPFHLGGSSTVTVTATRPGTPPTTIDTWTGTAAMTLDYSPGAIIRQAIYDVLAADATMATYSLLYDAWGRPEMAYQDMPFVGSQIVIEVGPAKSDCKKVSRVRADGNVQVEINIYCLNQSTAEAVVLCDTACWNVQTALNRVDNLKLGCLGLMNYAWSFSADLPDVIDVDGQPSPVVSQTLTLDAVVSCVRDQGPAA
jgi:hypothetical protein